MSTALVRRCPLEGIVSVRRITIQNGIIDVTWKYDRKKCMCGAEGSKEKLVAASLNAITRERRMTPWHDDGNAGWKIQNLAYGKKWWLAAEASKQIFYCWSSRQKPDSNDSMPNSFWHMHAKVEIAFVVRLTCCGAKKSLWADQLPCVRFQ